MAANAPESRIPPTTARWSGRCGPALNPLRGIFSIRLHPLGPGHHMMLQYLKALGRRRHWHICRWKPAIGNLHPGNLPLILLASLLSFLSLQCQVHAIVEQIFHKAMFLLLLRYSQIILWFCPAQSSHGKILVTKRTKYFNKFYGSFIKCAKKIISQCDLTFISSVRMNSIRRKVK